MFPVNLCCFINEFEINTSFQRSTYNRGDYNRKVALSASGRDYDQRGFYGIVSGKVITYARGLMVAMLNYVFPRVLLLLFFSCFNYKNV